MTEVFGRNPRDWHRLERSLGRFRLVGTTIKDPERWPRHLVTDEKHTTLAGQKVTWRPPLAAAGGGCCLGMAWAKTADQDDRTSASGVSGMRPEIGTRRTGPRPSPELDDLGLTRGLSQGSPKFVISREFVHASRRLLGNKAPLGGLAPSRAPSFRQSSAQSP